MTTESKVYRDILEEVLNIIDPAPSHENIVLAARRLVEERDDWKTVAERLYTAATQDTACEDWNLVFKEYELLRENPNTKPPQSLAK